jgi:large subunit ribosomal protein L21
VFAGPDRPLVHFSAPRRPSRLSCVLEIFWLADVLLLAKVALMYAILETGGKQYKVEKGDVIEVDRLDGDVGAQIEVGRVLMVAGDDGAPTFGSPAVDGARVFGEVVEQGKGDKIIIFRYKPKVRYRRKTGHRQHVTRVRIGDIVGPE